MDVGSETVSQERFDYVTETKNTLISMDLNNHNYFFIPHSYHRLARSLCISWSFRYLDWQAASQNMLPWLQSEGLGDEMNNTQGSAQKCQILLLFMVYWVKKVTWPSLLLVGEKVELNVKEKSSIEWE